MRTEIQVLQHQVLLGAGRIGSVDFQAPRISSEEIWRMSDSSKIHRVGREILALTTIALKDMDTGEHKLFVQETEIAS